MAAPPEALPPHEPQVDVVQIDSLVIMKLVKHVDSEFYSGMSDAAGEACQGILTGLISAEDRRLEITNCFPTPRPELLMDADDGQANAHSLEDKQNEVVDMLRRFRKMNIDYELVGFYQSYLFGACYSQEMVESLFDYQDSLFDSVILVYDPVATRQGRLAVRALRLTPKAFDLYTNTDFSPEALKNSGVTYSNLLEELPIFIKNSHLMNVMLAELRLLQPKKTAPNLELGTRGSLEKTLRAMVCNVEELNKSIGAYNKYTLEKQRYDAVLNSLIQKRQIENEARAARGEARLSIEDLKRQQKQPQIQTRNGMIELFLNAADTDAYANFTAKVTGDNIAKLFMSEAAGQSAQVPAERETPL
ncbi:unnamed protein product [Bursaphelenchus xylophilus]|uniref:Eukaryotic translation initiation factor 3 subunit H n=1 Tax=Bursaphelenchus xylophilus TaxID=6326 RepID=A0A1I7SBZ6_BURXY|nr:unnamed protein product [Bursaphelenchus xylophilus]CAG9088989.1 unnamed protein product [Bursaphelenchus xylophilus]